VARVEPSQVAARAEGPPRARQQHRPQLHGFKSQRRLSTARRLE
jgi:hypothetical protein